MKPYIILIIMITAWSVAHGYGQIANIGIASLIKQTEAKIYSRMKQDPFFSADLSNCKVETESVTDNDKVVEILEFSKGVKLPGKLKVPPLPQVGPNASFQLDPGAVVVRLGFATEDYNHYFDSRMYFLEGGMRYFILPSGVYDHIQSEVLDFRKVVGFRFVISLYTNPNTKELL